MSKSLLAGFALVLSIAGQQSIAASIYTFSGQVSSWGALPGGTNNLNLEVGSSVFLQVALDAGKPGHTPSTGVELPGHSMSGDVLSSQEYWTRSAELLQSNVPVDNNASGSYSNSISLNAWGPEYNYYAGSIGVGFFRFGKSMPLGDTSAFVENWQVGDTLSFTAAPIDFSVIYFGSLTLTSISEPLPSIVPLPSAGLMFLSGLMGIGGAARWRRKTH